MLTQIEIVSGHILTLLELKRNALAFNEKKDSIPDESALLIQISLHWLVNEGLIAENVLTKEFKIMELDPVNVSFTSNCT